MLTYFFFIASRYIGLVIQMIWRSVLGSIFEVLIVSGVNGRPVVHITLRFGRYDKIKKKHGQPVSSVKGSNCTHQVPWLQGLKITLIFFFKSFIYYGPTFEVPSIFNGKQSPSNILLEGPTSSTQTSPLSIFPAFAQTTPDYWPRTSLDLSSTLVWKILHKKSILNFFNIQEVVIDNIIWDILVANTSLSTVKTINNYLVYFKPETVQFQSSGNRFDFQRQLNYILF